MTPNNNVLSEDTKLQSPEFTYRIEKVLGQGGFGITYLATADVMVGNIPQEFKFAIKEHFVSELCGRNSRTLCVEYSEPVSNTVNKSRRDFLSEARRLQQLGINHPNIVRINEVFEANNTAYYVMEYLGDMTLQQYVAQKGRLTLEETKAILGPIIDAVAMIHDNHLAHYDIKPGNIMLQSKRGRLERPVLIDFGLAKHYDENGNATSTLGAGGYSTGYASLEQTQGIREFSPRCDVYALAATAYYCLTGQRPPEAIKARHETLLSALTAVTDSRTANAIVHGMAMLDENRTPDARSLANEVFGIVLTETRPITIPTITDTRITPDIVEIDLDSNEHQEEQPSIPKVPNPPYVRPKDKPKSPDPRVKTNKKPNKWLIIILVMIPLLCIILALIQSHSNSQKSEYYYDESMMETPAEDYYYDEPEEAAVPEEATPADYYYETPAAEVPATDYYYEPQAK